MTAPTPVPQPDDVTYADLNPAEVEWVKINLDWLAEAGWDGEATTLERLLDQMAGAWRAADELDRPDPNELVNAFGIGLGDVLNRRLGTRWQVFHEGEAAALCCHDAGHAVTLFPVESVARTFEAGDEGWLVAFADAVCAQVEQIRTGG